MIEYFRNLSLGETKHFKNVQLSSEFIDELPANAFADIQFDKIIIDGASSLSRIHSQAFNGTHLSLKELRTKGTPITYVDKLETPLLIHSNTNDEDVNVIEVQRFVAALKAAGKKFEYKIYDNAPGGHEFGRLDTKLAKESRQDIYKFLATYLKPEKPL